MADLMAADVYGAVVAGFMVAYAVREVRTAWAKRPVVVKDRYGRWRAQRGMENRTPNANKPPLKRGFVAPARPITAVDRRRHDVSGQLATDTTSQRPGIDDSIRLVV